MNLLNTRGPNGPVKSFEPNYTLDMGGPFGHGGRKTFSGWETTSFGLGTRSSGLLLIPQAGEWELFAESWEPRRGHSWEGSPTIGDPV